MCKYSYTIYDSQFTRRVSSYKQALTFLDMEEGHGIVLLLGTLHDELHFLNIHSLFAWGQHRQDSRVIKGVCCVRNRSLLAEKLLGKTDYECDREIRTLELLKLRFGEANLHNCEVGRELSPSSACPSCTAETGSGITQLRTQTPSLADLSVPRALLVRCVKIHGMCTCL